MASSAQVEPNELASDWITKAMASAELSVPELARKSGIPRMTIYNIINQRQKNSCRFDVIVRLVASCGLTPELR